MARTTAEASADVVSGPASEREFVAVVDFGSQYSQLIARRVRECNVYCELVPWDTPTAELRRLDPKAYILSGGPASVYEPGAPSLNPAILESDRPVLGICYGMQLMAHNLGGRVAPATRREYGHAVVCHSHESPIFAGLPDELPVWMSHADHIDALPTGFKPLASSANSPIAAMGRDGQIGLQFHPEVMHTRHGKQILENFLFKIVGLRGDWTPASFIDESIGRIATKIGDGFAICGLSGGVDSAVAATLVHRAIGDRLTCIFVDHGMLREGEAEQVQDVFRDRFGLRLVYVDASERFLAKLSGVIDPEEKRRRIGAEFIRVFETEAAKLEPPDYLVQGTLYPDVIESATRDSKSAAKIKTHHNVGGLPEDLGFQLVEPLRFLFKDEVRTIGAELGLPDEIVWRHPFPGPGLAIRIIGEITAERLTTLRQADRIFIEELRGAGLYREVAQALAVLTPLQTVGVMGDGRTYANAVALRAVTTDDFMTAEWARLPYDLLAKVSTRIVNEVPAVNRVVYDISTKPPATIEWE